MTPTRLSAEQEQRIREAVASGDTDIYADGPEFVLDVLREIDALRVEVATKQAEVDETFRDMIRHLDQRNEATRERDEARAALREARGAVNVFTADCGIEGIEYNTDHWRQLLARIDALLAETKP
jgi:hypothetical protein